MSNGPSLGPSCQRGRAGQTVEDAPGGSIARYSMASSGSSGPALPGPTCRTAIRRIRPAIGDFSTGPAPAYCGASSKFSRRRCTTKAIWIWTKRSSTEASRPRSKVGPAWAKTKRGKGSKIMAIADRQGFPIAVHVESATPHEVTLVRATLATRFVRLLPARLIGDNAYESDRLDAALARRGVELIAPHRRNRRHRTQDGRPLRRYQRRWKIERLFAWFQNFRRLVVRYERFAEKFLGMLHLACWLILLRGL
jgi:transposase